MLAEATAAARSAGHSTDALAALAVEEMKKGWVVNRWTGEKWGELVFFVGGCNNKKEWLDRLLWVKTKMWGITYADM